MGRSTWVYLGSYCLSLLGNGIASVVFPLLVLARTGDVLAAGVVAGASAAAAAVVGLLAGVVVDRVNRRTVSIVSDVLSAASVAALPVVDALWGLDMTWFLVLAVVGALGDAPGMTARETLLPGLVRLSGDRPGSLDRLVGIREALAGAVLLAGPGLGGLLVAVLGVGSAVLLVTAGASVAAALLTLLVQREAGAVSIAPRPGGTEQARGLGTGVRQVLTDLGAAWRFVLTHRLVRGTTFLSASLVAVVAALQTTVMPAYFTAADAPGLTGLVLSGFSLGALLGAGLYAATAGRVARRAWFVVGMVGMIVGFTAIGTLAAPWVVLAAAVLIGLTNGPVSAVLGVATIEATPDAMRGRVLGAQNALMMAAPAVSTAPVAAVATTWGLPAAGLALAAVVAATAVVALLVPAFRVLHAGAPVGRGEQEV
ncbi:MFS transporter [Xylanimonas oleitrophica]|uniref:Multidrug efflux pump Tap n=1 Tax=Xylanimonas oleitrophica TaxID=2607479 RepID=A0A2W5WQ93_9MICO|nr:MFS transporter [Xylanimonas oleitrophica]PZR53122.1 MFS transporter [Xylanimonas oleitrophica]